MKIQSLFFGVCLLSSIVASSQADSTSAFPGVFTKVDKDASFPGGDATWRKFLEKNLNPSVPVERSAPTGMYTVMVQFVVSTEGKVSDIKALTNNGYGTEQEVVRLLRVAGNWEPAMLDGKPVNAYRKQPVIFMVSEEGFDISPYSIYADRDNEITIDVDKVKNEDLNVSISRGTIKRGADGKFIANVTGGQRVIVRVYNKKNKQVGTASLEVKPSAFK